MTSPDTEGRREVRLVERLPVAAHVAHAFTPRETGSSCGSDHIVVEEDFAVGRLKRVAADALCKPYRKFWGLYPVESDRAPTCKCCIEIAERAIFLEATK